MVALTMTLRGRLRHVRNSPESLNLPQPPRLSSGCTVMARSLSVTEMGLFLSCEGREFRLYHPKNLYSFVQISYGDPALKFVFFFTSHRTYFLMGVQGFVYYCCSNSVS